MTTSVQPDSLLRFAWRTSSRLVWSLLAPAAAAILAAWALIPTRIDGGSDGMWAVLARFGDEHPLLVFLALFIVCSETLRYWRLRVRTSLGTAPTTLGAAVPQRRGALRYAVLFALAGLSALIVRTEVAEIYRVISPSMVPTLDVGDRLLVDKMAYGVKLPFSTTRIASKAPRRGDVVVFVGEPGHAAGSIGSRAIVKRVIGLPGDYVAFDSGHPIVNNRMLPSCDAGPFGDVVGSLTIKGRLVVEYLEDIAYLTVRTPGAESFNGYRVLPGEVFVIGDDRGVSSDSRVWNEGHGAGVPLASIGGKVTRIIAGGHRDGRLDLSRLFAPLGVRVREGGLDLRQTEQRIEACLKTRPAPTLTTPPPPNG